MNAPKMMISGPKWAKPVLFTIEIIEKEEAPDYTVDTLSLDVIAEVTELRPNAQDSENVNCGLLNRLPLGANRAKPL